MNGLYWATVPPSVLGVDTIILALRLGADPISAVLLGLMVILFTSTLFIMMDRLRGKP